MPTNNYPGVGKTVNGHDFNFYQKVSATATDFGSNAVDGVQPDLVVPFSSQTLLFFNEGSGIVEYSFNGNTVHGEMDPSLASKSLTFQNRVVSKIWFRIKSGSSGPVTVRVDAWAHR